MILFSHSEGMYTVIVQANMTSTLIMRTSKGETKKEADNYDTG